MTTLPPTADPRPTNYRYGVLVFCALLAMLNYLDRVCFSNVAKFIQAEFFLSDAQLGYLFGAFALAYAICEVPTGWMGDRFGPRVTLIRVVLWWSVFTALTGLIFPSMVGTARTGMTAVIVLVGVRFLFGAGEAGAFPNVSRAFANWIPLGERGFAQGTVWMAGRLAGGLTPFIVLALLIPTGETFAGEPVYFWRHCFWIFGFLGIIWCVFFWVWFRDRPDQKVGVNAAELAHIQAGQAPEVGHLAVPWGRLLTSWNLWALCLMYFCAAYGWYFNITWLPKFLDEQFDVNRRTWGFWMVSLLQGLPLLLGALACIIGGLLTDGYVLRTGNRRWGRRLYGMLGHGLCALCYLLSVYARNPILFVLAVAAASFWNDLTMGPAWASCIDIGRRYAGVVSGMMNMIGNLGGFVAGVATGLILNAYTLPVKQERAAVVAAVTTADVFASMGNPFGQVTGVLTGPAVAPQVQELNARYLEQARIGWNLNLYSYAIVYALAVLLWWRFDASQPIVAEGEPRLD